ncbi:MAG: hypothetical protein L0L18_00940 [Acidipropionibacterium jensenii]|nr:hypothetical protein [Acidipropionibacterium jensenii]
MNKQQAETLWANLRSNLLAAEDNIRQIITTRAWEPLGYESFAECWADRLGDVKLAGELRAVVVYAMFDDGATDRDVALAVDGVGVSTVTALRDAHRKGLDAGDAAAMGTRPKWRSAKTQPTRYVTVSVTVAEHDALVAAAEAADIALGDYVHMLLTAGTQTGIAA